MTGVQTCALPILFGTQKDADVPRRSRHVHDIRRAFHSQMKRLWLQHPTLSGIAIQSPDIVSRISLEDFTWLPLVTESNGLICKLDILMLRAGPPGRVIADIDNRLKTIFDALRMARTPEELGSRTPEGQLKPLTDETPFFVLLENDHLITHVSVTTDTILEPVPPVPEENAVRLVIGVTVRPYHAHTDNLDYV